MLKYTISTIEGALRNSLFGTLSMVFGGSIIFNSSADSWLLISLLCFGIVGVMTYFYHKDDKVKVITIQTNNDNTVITQYVSNSSSSDNDNISNI